MVLAGKELPLIFASDGQINAQVPFDLPLNTDHQISGKARISSFSTSECFYRLRPTSCLHTQSDRAWPGSYCRSGVPSRSPIQRHRFVLARRSSFTALVWEGSAPPFLQAFSAVEASRTTVPVTVTIGGRPAEVAYAGMSPGSIGLYQINTVIPSGVSAGDAVPIAVEVAGQKSPEVTIAIR